MSEHNFPKSVSEVTAILAEIFHHQKKRELVDLLRTARASLEQTYYDNIDGGIYTWALRLEIPVSLLASIESRLGKIEEEIKAKLIHFNRLHHSDHIGEVTISPASFHASAFGQRVAPSEIDIDRLWPAGQFRLFLSHLAKHKTAVSALKDELALRGVSAFVAHEDIEPSLEWQNEIEFGLQTMHALAALLTIGFKNSFWTDQEIGWALGRRVCVLPVQLGVNPYGFIGKYQWVAGDLSEPIPLAESIVRALLSNPQTQGQMRRSLIHRLLTANSFQMSIYISYLLVDFKNFTEDEKQVIWKACEENDQVSRATNVTKRIYRKIGEPSKPSAPEPDDIPF